MSLDDEVMRALVHQVSKAVPEGGSEQDVLTLITRPMWEIWCRAVGLVGGTLPDNGHHTRVYGSFTVLIESDQAAAGSIAFQR